MKVWRLGSYENFVGKRDELAFNAFSDSEPVKRAWDESDMTGLTSCNDSMRKRIPDLLENSVLEELKSRKISSHPSRKRCVEERFEGKKCLSQS